MKLNTGSKIVILGGGSAGWLTALFIQRNWSNVDITIVEDPKRPPIIAGESGTTTFTDFLIHLKIDKDDFIQKVNATPKLGGKFTDWNGAGTEFIHCLQTDFAPWLDDWGKYIKSASKEELTIGGIKSLLTAEHGRQIYIKTIIANDIPLREIFHANEFIKQNKVPFGAKSEIPCVPMWHFESRAAAAYFKKIGIERGITLVEGEYNISTRDIAGNISSIGLDHDRQISADWFFDCSGFARLLLEKTLGEKIVDYSDYFPARAVVAWWDEPETSLTTNAIAMKYGWSWNINLRHRSGNGYLYNPDMITLDQAVNEAETRFNKKIDPIANFTFVPGIMKNSWKNNVIGIGLSSGFLEPLEANGVAVIIEALYALHDHWDPHDNNSDYSIARFNDKVFTITDDIKDFLALHYRGQRRDTEFWLDHHHNPKRTPESLRQKLWIWNTYFDGRSDAPIFNGYSPTAWLTVIQGLNIFNNTALKNQVENKLELGRAILNNTKSKYETMVNPHWTIDEWILKTA